MESLPSELIRLVYDYIGTAPDVMRISTAAPALRSVIVNPRLLAERYRAVMVERRIRRLVAACSEVEVSLSLSRTKRPRAAIGAVRRKVAPALQQFGIWRLGLDSEAAGRTIDRALGVVDATALYQDVEDLADQLERTALVSPSIAHRLDRAARRIELYAEGPFKK